MMTHNGLMVLWSITMKTNRWWLAGALVGLSSVQQFAGCSDQTGPPADEIVNYCAVFDCDDGAFGGIIQWCTPEFKAFNDCP